LKNVIPVESPDGNIRAELSLETFWVGNTVYPSLALLRIWYRGYRLIEDMPVSPGDALFGVEIGAVEESTSEMRLGSALQKMICLQERAGEQREFKVSLRLSNVSVFFDVQAQGESVAAPRPALITSAPLISVPGDQPSVAYVGPGAIAASWPHHHADHLVIFSRPGLLAEMRFNVLEDAVDPVVNDGADGIRMLYTRLPFSSALPGSAVYSDAITLSYRKAFNVLLEHYAGTDHDFRVMRGDPGHFAVVARRIAERWIVCGLTAKSRTLTIRLEDLWLMLPDEMRALTWRASILRDPVLDEPGDIIEESFDGLAPDLRIALDLKKNGGFVIVFEPM
jgi:hypothetical protein